MAISDHSIVYKPLAILSKHVCPLSTLLIFRKYHIETTLIACPFHVFSLGERHWNMDSTLSQCLSMERGRLTARSQPIMHCRAGQKIFVVSTELCRLPNFRYTLSPPADDHENRKSKTTAVHRHGGNQLERLVVTLVHWLLWFQALISALVKQWRVDWFTTVLSQSEATIPQLSCRKQPNASYLL